MKNNEVKILPISKTRKIVIYPDNDNNFLPNDTISYQNLGIDYPSVNNSPIYTQNVIIDNEKHIVNVLSPSGEVEFYFPLSWMSVVNGMIHKLVEAGVLK